MSFLKAAFLLGALASSVSAHGILSTITVDGKTYQGTTPGTKSAGSIEWDMPGDTDHGYVAPDAYGTPDIICHKQATPGSMSAPAKPGSKIDLKWDTWPDSHKGPIVTYMAKCSGSCSTVDKTTLEFFKIDEIGPTAVSGGYSGGTWGTDELIANGFSWTVTVPTGLAPGNYVLRHEIIALHAANAPDGAQNYPMCVNLDISGSGTNSPSGVAGESLYKETDPGIAFNIYVPTLGPSTYPIPGPKLCQGAVSTGQSGTGSSTPGGAPFSNSTAASSSSMKKGPKPASTSQASAAKTSAASPVVQVVPAQQSSPSPVVQEFAAKETTPTVPAAAAHTTVVVDVPGASPSEAASVVSSVEAANPTDSVDQVISQVTKILKNWAASHGGNHARDLSRRNVLRSRR